MAVAGELKNAVVMMSDPKFSSWIMAASSYVARTVIAEDPSTANYAIRHNLAKDVLFNPQLHLARFINMVATDPSIASLGTDPELIGQSVIISGVQNNWTSVAMSAAAPVAGPIA